MCWILQEAVKESVLYAWDNLCLSVFISFPLVCFYVHIKTPVNGCMTILIQDDLHLRYSCEEYL